MGGSSGLRPNFRVRARSSRMTARRSIPYRAAKGRGLGAPTGQSLPNRSELSVVSNGVKNQVGASNGRVDT